MEHRTHYSPMECESANLLVHPFTSGLEHAGSPRRGRGRSAWLAVAAVLVSGLAAFSTAWAQTGIPVPNGSFESPETVFALPQVDSWGRTPKPPWFIEQPPNQVWTNLAGVFLNTAPGEPDHIGNMDGDQGLFLFAVPQVGLFQDYDSIGGTNTVPDNAFDAIFQTGGAYTLTVGVIGGGGGMTEGASLGLGLYYRDAGSNRVSVAMTNVAFTAGTFPTTTNLVDISLTTPVVTAGDPWAGKYIGVELLSTVGFTYTNGGYWDLDNVRLTESVAPRLVDPVWSNGQFQFTLISDAGSKCEILSSTNVGLALSNWISLGVVTNVAGTTNLHDSGDGATRRFYGARRLP